VLIYGSSLLVGISDKSTEHTELASLQIG